MFEVCFSRSSEIMDEGLITYTAVVHLFYTTYGSADLKSLKYMAKGAPYSHRGRWLWKTQNASSVSLSLCDLISEIRRHRTGSSFNSLCFAWWVLAWNARWANKTDFAWMFNFFFTWVGLLCLQAGTIVSTSTSHCDATSSSSCCRHTFQPHLWWCCHGCRSGSIAGLCRPEFPLVSKRKNNLSSNVIWRECACVRKVSLCAMIKAICYDAVPTGNAHKPHYFLLNYFLCWDSCCFLSHRHLFPPSLRSLRGSSHCFY